MKKLLNPFELMTYSGPDYFCDRIDEVDMLNSALNNRRNTIISSLRRLGKTNLIQHWHHLLNTKQETKTIYLDILHTKSDSDFLNFFVNRAINAVEEDKNYFQKVFEKLSSIRPTLSIDPISGQPQITFDTNKGNQIEFGISTTFELLSKHFNKIQIAIDEFQTISTYETGTKIDAVLRTCMTEYKGFHFLYSGSQEHLLSTIFADPQKPMFGSTQHYTLQKIGYRPYFEFIKGQFEAYDRQISDEAIHEILMWTRQHTFYTHFLCNEVFASGNKKADISLVQTAERKCLHLFEVNFLSTLRNLSNNQKKVLIAIAKEGDVENIHGKDFLSKYKLAASSVSQATEVLENREVIKKDLSKAEPTYFLQDVFLSNYLRLYN
jgi:chlorite dismutase